jgi:hypothetical protein
MPCRIRSNGRQPTARSWAQWINNGTGGPVCTREVEQRPDGEVVLIG